MTRALANWSDFVEHENVSCGERNHACACLRACTRSADEHAGHADARCCESCSAHICKGARRERAWFEQEPEQRKAEELQGPAKAAPRRAQCGPRQHDCWEKCDANGDGGAPRACRNADGGTGTADELNANGANANGPNATRCGSYAHARERRAWRRNGPNGRDEDGEDADASRSSGDEHRRLWALSTTA